MIPLFGYHGRKEKGTNYFPWAHSFAIHPIWVDLKGDNSLKKKSKFGKGGM